MGERHPALDIRLFGYRNFTIGIICSMLGFLSIQGLLALFVVQLQLLLGYSSSLAGLVFIAMILLPVPIVAVAHELMKEIDARLFASLSFLGFAFTLFWMGVFDHPSYFDQIFWPMLFLGFFVGTFFAPLAVITLHGLPPRVILRATEEAGLLRMAAGAFGIALEGVVLYRRTPFHQLALADHFGGRRFASLDLVQQFSDKLESSGLSPDMVMSQLGAYIMEEASLLAMNDAFLLASFVFLGLAAFVWLALPPMSSSNPRRKVAEVPYSLNDAIAAQPNGLAV
jgi:MFS transporter, DHA2 family, multidrug resistance protein